MKSGIMRVAKIMVVCFLGVVLSGSVCLSQTSSTVPSEPETRGQKLMEQAIVALGGTAYLSVKDITLKGRYYQIYHGSASGAAVFTDYIKYPDMERRELGKKKENIIINNGEHGWEIDFRGVHTSPPEQVEQYHRNQKYALDRIMRFDVSSRKYRIYFDGTDVIEATKYDIITLEDTHRERFSVLLNAVTHLPEAVRFRLQSSLSKGVDRMESWYGNYQEVQGIRTPFHRVRTRNGERISEMFVNEASYNSGLPDSLFVPPGKK